MELVQFPSTGTSAEYGDIVFKNVSHAVTFSVKLNNVEILRELFYPDNSGYVYIRNLGELALMYEPDIALKTQNAMYAGKIGLQLTVTEDEMGDSYSPMVIITPCELESAGTLDERILDNIPLSRTVNKVTSVRRTEMISFWGGTPKAVKLYIVFKGAERDMAVTIDSFYSTISSSRFCVNVSPTTVAARAGCSVSDLIYYNVYTSTDYVIRYTVDPRNYPNERTFVFLNSFHAIETFTCFSSEESERTWERNAGVSSNKQILISRQLENIYTVNTGYILRSDVEVLEDLLNSEKVALVDEYGLHNVIFTGEEFKVLSQRNELINVQLSYRYASVNQLQIRYKAQKKGGVFDKTFDKMFN